MIAMLRRLRSKIPNVALGVIVGLVAGGGAFAVAQTTGSDGVHGGPKPRFHDARECNLVDVSKLPGNWTHGDYVSAVEKADPSKVRDAARSRCGKPSHAGKGRGPKEKGGSTPKPEKSAKPSKTPKPSRTASTPASTPSSSPTPTASPSSTATASPSPAAS